LADVFDAEIRALSVGNSSALGAALRAAEAVSGVSFASLYERFAATDDTRSASPRAGAPASYADLRQRFVQRLTALSA
jgi:sugar (pentulose or hexulose) kinase